MKRFLSKKTMMGMDLFDLMGVIDQMMAEILEYSDFNSIKQ